MAHLFIPTPFEAELPVFFNVDGVVGAQPAQNKREDVLLVQFSFGVIANSPLRGTRPEFLTACKAVRMTGIVDKETIEAIRAMQKHNSLSTSIVDGRISPARGGTSYGQATWSIAILMNSLQHRHMDIWPRIDKISGCPAEIQQLVKRTVAGI